MVVIQLGPGEVIYVPIREVISFWRVYPVSFSEIERDYSIHPLLAVRVFLE